MCGTYTVQPPMKDPLKRGQPLSFIALVHLGLQEIKRQSPYKGTNS